MNQSRNCFSPRASRALLCACVVLVSACGKGYDEEIDGVLTLAPAKNLKQLEIRSDAIDSKLQAYTKFVKPGKKVIQFKSGSSQASLMIMTEGRVPIAKYTIPADKFDTKSDSFFATAAELKQQYNLGGARVKHFIRRETVGRGDGRVRSCTVYGCYKDYDLKTKTWVDRTCPGLTGKVWYVEDASYDYELNFTVADPKDPKNLVAQFIGKGDPKTEASMHDDGVCRPRLKIYQKGRFDNQLTQAEWESVK